VHDAEARGAAKLGARNAGCGAKFAIAGNWTHPLICRAGVGSKHDPSRMQVTVRADTEPQCPLQWSSMNFV
jgi:hypothetical protein